MDEMDRFAKQNNIYDKIKSSIRIIDKLMVDFCRKLNSLDFVECATTLKSDKKVADVIKILKSEYKEELDTFKNLLNKLEKIPELVKKYYNIELDNVVEIIVNLLKEDNFTYDEKKNSKILENKNEITFKSK